MKTLLKIDKIEQMEKFFVMIWSAFQHKVIISAYAIV